ncbi:GNAT family N-acetyltransferase [Brucella sp. RRSP16]|uniref:GNAT family N-acetyltransferase n=1 Tax=unclassified Brucella TaxID=2632610 RepID=UPI0015E04A94|nr:GNAT family N-acetyltransferase [Brucella sp. 191011898]CAB4325015.1 hypothetical protein BCH_00234 [Brucella sp. 191011898]
MIVAATDLEGRARAVDFAMRIIRGDVCASDRRKRSLSYALDGNYFGIDCVDDEPGGGVRVGMGRYNFPIWTCHQGGELVGAAICSGAAPELPLRLMMLAVREDCRGSGVGGALVRHLIDSAPVVGVAVNDAGLRRYYAERGFAHWYGGASGGDVGFTKTVSGPRGLLFVVPVATDEEIADGERRLLHDELSTLPRAS